MAILQDHSNFKITVIPEFTNWWSFYFDFTYYDKSVFNEEILGNKNISKNGVFKADEDSNHPLLPVLEKAMKSITDEETFYWGAWEDELEIEIKTINKNPNPEINSVFDFTVFVAEQAFKDGSMNYGFQNAGVRLALSREDLKKFHQDLKAEMDLIEESIQKGEKVNVLYLNQ